MKKILLSFFIVFPAFVFAQIGFEQHVVIDNTFGTPYPQRVAAGDIDGDTYSDVLVGGSGKLAWHKNTNGLGTFSTAKTVAPGLSSFNSVAIADMDNDTYPDVVYSIWSGNLAKVYWQKNTDGLGTFGAAIQINTNNNYLMKLEVIDFDNDGDNDVVLNSFDNVILLKNDGAGVFTTSNLLGANNSFHIVDVTGDGLADVIRVAGYDLVAFKQNVDGTLTLLDNMDGFAQTTLIFSADIDNDGDTDILTIFENGGAQRRIKWYQNTNGLGTFAANQVLVTLPNLAVTSSNDTKGLQFSDFDGDGKLDIMLSESSTNKLCWYKNLTGTTFGTEQIITTDASNVREAVAVDVNSDGDDDIVSVSYDDGDVAWYKNTNGLGAFSAANMVSYYAYSVNHIDVGDFNNDGTPDILSTSHGDKKVAWYKNVDGLGSFSQPQALISKSINGTRNGYAKDMDGDGDLDALYTYYLDDNVDVFNIRWKENNGSGIFTTEHVVYVGIPDLYAITPCDIDADGDTDIVAVFNLNNLMVLKNNGNGTFAPQQLFNFPVGSLGYIVVEDVDGDGDLDVISSGSNKFAWYENTNGQGDLSVEHLIPLSNNSSRVLNTADLDGDGDQDILFINRTPNKIGWFENTDGAGTFGPEIILATVTKPLSILAVDLDGDGDQDIVCDAEQGFRLQLFENNGNATFSAGFEITSQIGRVTSLVAEDMDADGDLDLITSSYDDDQVAWFENLGSFRNTLQGTVRIDTDSNGCNSTDVVVPNVLVTTDDGANTFSTFTGASGQYVLYANEGNYTTSVTTPLPNYPPNPNSQVWSFEGVNQTQVVDFCLEPSTLFEDLEVSLVPLNLARPGFVSKYRIHIKNTGTNPMNGVLTFTYNPVKFSFITSSTATSSQTANSLSFTFTNLNAFQTKIIDLEFQVATIPTTTIGESVLFTATLNENTNDVTPENNTFLFHQLLVGAYDPNDIQVVEGPEIAFEDVDNYLHYIIRFQNTGNFYAQKVVVTNELDDKLDWTTFQLESYSHPNRVELLNGTSVDFIFNAIYLPSVNQDEEGSQGYIAYKIKPKTSVGLGDVISNTASIYFDYNPAIITNTVTTTVVETVLSSPSFETESVTLYPNPTSGWLTINSKAIISKIEVYNQLGQQVLQSDTSSSIDLSALSQGVYFIRFVDSNEQVLIKKVIKQ
ncbi:MAG TPA: T9SS type A sorting domain-containing protein [Flavobacterium sp.]|nr:T9SS type A sorting domain-containing protein [Flavobacterium sp.]